MEKDKWPDNFPGKTDSWKRGCFRTSACCQTGSTWRRSHWRPGLSCGAAGRRHAAPRAVCGWGNDQDPDQTVALYSLTLGKAVPGIDVAVVHVHDEDALVVQEVPLVSVSLLVKGTAHGLTGSTLTANCRPRCLGARRCLTRCEVLSRPGHLELEGRS